MLALTVLLFSHLVRALVVSYPPPSIYSKSSYFSLTVNGSSMNTVEYAGYDYVQLSMNEGFSTEFRITVIGRPNIHSYNISPKRLLISASITGNQLVFSTSEAHYLIVKIDDEQEFIILADPAEKDVPSSSGTGVYNVKDYGATGTSSDMTAGIQSAMDAAASHSGSTVYVPPGLYYIGNLLLRNNTSLYLAGGSVLRFTGNISDYETLFTKPSLGPGTWWIQTEFDSQNIKIYGRGTIDGNGYISANTGKFVASLVVPVGTTNFLYDGPLVRDSSFWAITPIQSDGVVFRNLKILNRRDIGEDDGVDIIESRNVTVSRAIAITLDDSFSTKTWPYNSGITVPYPNRPQVLSNVTFEDCLAWSTCYGYAWSTCYGYKIGQGAYKAQDTVTFRNSVIYNASVGLGIDHRYGTATINNITFDTIDIESLGGENAGHATWLAFLVELTTSGIGSITGIKVNAIKVRNAGQFNGQLIGYNSSAMISNVTFTNVYMLANNTPATSLEEMKILDINYTSAITVE